MPDSRPSNTSLEINLTNMLPKQPSIIEIKQEGSEHISSPEADGQIPNFYSTNSDQNDEFLPDILSTDLHEVHEIALLNDSANLGGSSKDERQDTAGDVSQ